MGGLDRILDPAGVDVLVSLDEVCAHHVDVLPLGDVHNGNCRPVGRCEEGVSGAVDRADFDAAMRTRGGGMTNALVREGLAELAARYRVTDVQVTSVDVAPVETLDVTVRNPAKPDQLDRYTFDGESLSEASPVMVSALEDLDARAFRLGDVPALGRVEALVDDALAHTGFDGGAVAGIFGEQDRGAMAYGDGRVTAVVIEVQRL
ncbi:hypothetical protein [Rhodococcus sp. NCIMB 12038]|uniref:hypothetical protein n=1 Tax=Rhodococcus sp. NCIMB 12038 TaxID=933800 RepID=UPI0015C673B7|nr:hypothetical protein [Rhodococcus sp. NCIMB 12038]